MTIVGAVLASVGAIFVLIAAVGLLRLPDVLSRLHAATKAMTLGTIGLLSGVVLLVPGVEVAVKLGLAVVFQILTAPISAHVIGRATYRTGIPHRAEIDELAEALEEAEDRRRDGGDGTTAVDGR